MDSIESIIGIVRSLTLIFWSFALIFFFCHSCQSVTDRFSQLDNAVYHCEWHSYPIKVQRILPIIMLALQQPVVFHGFGNVFYTREAFKNVSTFDGDAYEQLCIKSFCLVLGCEWRFFLLYASSSNK